MNPQGSADTAGYFIGLIFFAAVFIVPLILNFVALGKRSASKMCVLSIIFVLASWLLCSLLGLAQRQTPHPILAGLAGLAALVGILASTVLAIIGLVQFRARHYRHGRKRAITALVLNGLFGTILLVGIVTGVRQGFQGRSFAGATAPAVFHSEKFGYTVSLAGTPWNRHWDTLATDSPCADFGIATASRAACCTVIPLALGDEAADLDTLSTALLSRFSIPFPDDAIVGLKDWKTSAIEGRDFTWSGPREGRDFLYRFRIMHSRGCAYLVAAWLDRKIETNPAILNQAIDAVVLDPHAAPPRTPERLTDRERTAHGVILNALALVFDAKGQSADALPWFKRALDFNPRDTTVLGNYVETCIKLGRHAEALASLDEHLAKFPGNQKLAAKRADAQYASGDAEGGLKAFGALFEAGYRDDSQFTGYVNELCAHDQADTALAAIERYTAAKETPALRRLRATVLVVRREFEKATAILLALQTEAPKDTETTLALADCYFAATRHTEALAECEKLIAANRDSAYVWRRKGFVEFSLKRYREAKTSFEKAHEKDPPNAEIKRMLDHVSGMLGEGGNTLVKKTIEPVPVPAALTAEPPADKAGAYLRGFSAYYVNVVRAISFEKGAELKTTERVAIRVLDAQGVEKFSTLEIGFDPLSEEIFVNSLLVKNPAGEVVTTGRVEDSYVVDDGAGETATQRKMLHLPVPGLKPGFTLEYTVTRRDTGAADSFRFRPHQFARALPALRSALHVIAPREALKWEGTPGVPAPKTTNGSLTWVVEQPTVYRYEPLQAPADTFLPMLWMSDAHADWPGEAKTYLAEIKDRLAIDPSVRAAAAEATKGLVKDAEKTAALARFVQRELTYKAIEFGRRARLPAAAAQTLRNKYGDCKDHALLLAQLLESAGVPAHLALVSFSEALHPALPSLDQFDHMIVFLPSGKGGTFLDCTGKSGDLRTGGAPSGLATRQALILDPARPRLETIPDYATGSSGVLTARDISFPTESDLEVRESVTFTGFSASGMRSSLQAVEAANRHRWLLQTMTRELPAVDLREAQIENVDDPQAPLLLKLRYLVPRRFQTAGGQLIGQLPAIWERWFLAGDPVEQRQTPFKVWIPVNLESHVTLTPPAGWQAAVARSEKLDRPFCTGTANSQLEARKLHLDTQVTQRSGQFPPAEYRAYLDATATALGLVEQGMIFKRDGK